MRNHQIVDAEHGDRDGDGQLEVVCGCGELECRLRVCGKIEAEFSPRMNDKPLARVFKEHLCRIGRLRI